MPLHCTASGKLYLGSLEPDELDRLLESLTLTRNTGNTLTNKRDLGRVLNAIREEGGGVDDACGAWAGRAHERCRRRRHIPRLQRAARELSARAAEEGR